MKKHKNRIEIVGAYYIRMVIGGVILENGRFYQTKAAVLRAVRKINRSLFDPTKNGSYGILGDLPIYDYDGIDPKIGVENKRAKYEIIQ